MHFGIGDRNVDINAGQLTIFVKHHHGCFDVGGQVVELILGQLYVSCLEL